MNGGQWQLQSASQLCLASAVSLSPPPPPHFATLQLHITFPLYRLQPVGARHTRQGTGLR